MGTGLWNPGFVAPDSGSASHTEDGKVVPLEHVPDEARRDGQCAARRLAAACRLSSGSVRWLCSEAMRPGGEVSSAAEPDDGGVQAGMPTSHRLRRGLSGEPSRWLHRSPLPHRRGSVPVHDQNNTFYSSRERERTQCSSVGRALSLALDRTRPLGNTSARQRPATAARSSSSVALLFHGPVRKRLERRKNDEQTARIESVA